MSFNLYLFRHGETQDNVQGIARGLDGAPLTDTGERQGVLAAQYFQQYNFDAFYSSDINRAVVLAHQFLEQHPTVPLEYRTELREGSAGIYEGRPIKEIDWSHPSVESKKQIKERIVPFFHEIYKRHPYRCNIAFFTHGAVIRNFVDYFTSAKHKQSFDAWSQRMRNTSVTKLSIDSPDSGSVVHFNIIPHLENIDFHYI